MHFLHSDKLAENRKYLYSISKLNSFCSGKLVNTMVLLLFLNRSQLFLFSSFQEKKPFNVQFHNKKIKAYKLTSPLKGPITAIAEYQLFILF